MTLPVRVVVPGQAIEHVMLVPMATISLRMVHALVSTKGGI